LGILCINYKAAENQFFELGTKRNDKETRPKLSEGGEGVTVREREREREAVWCNHVECAGDWGLCGDGADRGGRVRRGLEGAP